MGKKDYFHGIVRLAKINLDKRLVEGEPRSATPIRRAAFSNSFFYTHDSIADFVVETLADYGVRHAFMITGGGAMHLNDAVGRCSRIKYVCCHHEQACSIAAESYARVTGRPALVQVTTGPGGINALNGVFGAYTDSMPMIIVSGQVKRETCMAFQDVPGLRQLGDQEVDIVAMAQKITKSAVLLHRAEDIAYELGKAWHFATTGRPGPCWIDIPVDLQGAQIDPANLKQFEPASEPPLYDQALVLKQVPAILEKLALAERPVILVGSGVRVAGAMAPFEAVIERLGIPVVEAWSAPDALPNDHPLYCGRAGTIGDRAGNFAVQNADVLLILGSRLPLRQVSYSWQAFARHAYKIAVDIDPAEFPKPTAKIEFPVHADLLFFLENLRAAAAKSICLPEIRKMGGLVSRARGEISGCSFPPSVPGWPAQSLCVYRCADPRTGGRRRHGLRRWHGQRGALSGRAHQTRAAPLRQRR